MPAGRPQKANPSELYGIAQDIYQAFRHLVEGGFRCGFNKPKFDRAIAESEKKQLSWEDISLIRQQADGEVRAGRLNETQKEEWIRGMESDRLWRYRFYDHERAAESARIQVRVLGDPDVLDALFAAKTPNEVREICKDAFVPIPVQFGLVYKNISVANWPLPGGSGSPFPRYLSQHAEQFIAAKKDPRFPRSGRPTSQLKQLWFLSRALAGAVLGVRTRTALNLVGSKLPDQIFEESRAGKPERKRRRRKTR